MKKTACFIAQSEDVTKTIRKQLEDVLHGYAAVDACCLDCEETPPKKRYDVYVTSSISSHAQIRDLLPPGSLVLVADRFINPCCFDLLLDLPAGTRVILIANSRLGVEHLMQSIINFGITHLNFHLHYQGSPAAPPRDVTLAVVSGANRHVPHWVERVIDIGVRELALRTYADIFTALDVPSSALDKIAFSYMNSVFQSTRHHHHMKQKTAAIVESMDDAVLCVSSDGTIESCNETALCIFRSLGVERPLQIQDVFTELRAQGGEMFAHDLDDTVLKAGAAHYVARAKVLNARAEGASGAVVIIKPVGKVQELASKVRHKLQEKGYIARYSIADILGESRPLRLAVDLVRRFANTEFAVFIEGESGSGKELFAQAVHMASARRHGPFVAFNFAAIPETLVESELFGYEEGAFTGARRGGRSGLFEQAQGGTIFLDELGDAPLNTQAKLLRVLEEGEVRRVGGNRVIPVDVRVIAATNRKLKTMLREKTFRMDLFFRLCICPLYVPPLRERGDDVFLLAEQFARQRFGRSLRLAEPLEDFFARYAWPGNIRELYNVVTYLCMLLEEGQVCGLEHLPPYFAQNEPDQAKSAQWDEYDFLAARLREKQLLELTYHVLLSYRTACSHMPLG